MNFWTRNEDFEQCVKLKERRTFVIYFIFGILDSQILEMKVLEDSSTIDAKTSSTLTSFGIRCIARNPPMFLEVHQDHQLQFLKRWSLHVRPQVQIFWFFWFRIFKFVKWSQSPFCIRIFIRILEHGFQEKKISKSELDTTF